jgi:hypothetical protein
MYHRKNGKLVQLKDDLISALFKCIIDLRYARTQRSGASALVSVQTDWNELDAPMQGGTDAY